MIGEVPVGYEDLVKVRFVMRHAIEMTRCNVHISNCSAPNDVEKGCCLLVVAKCLEAPGKLGLGSTDGLLPTGEVGGILVAARAESICRLFRLEAALRER